MEVKPMAVPTLRTKLRHALLGCRPIDHVILAHGQIVKVGRICPYCFTEYPFSA